MAVTGRHTYEWRLILDDDNGTGQIAIISNRGQVLNFEKPGTSWSLVSPLHTPYVLTETQGHYLLADPDDELVFRFEKLNFRLVSIEDRNGNTVYMNYQPGRSGIGR